MAFLNFLGGLSGGGGIDPTNLLRLLSGAQDQGIGLDPSTVANHSIDPSLTANLPSVTPQQPQQQHKGLGFRNVLGIIGDSILQGHGRQPIYGPLHEKRQLQGALQNFLTDPDGAIQALMQVDAPTAISLYKMVHPTKAEPDIIAELKAAGIDPTSDEGKSILKEHLNRSGASSSFIQDLGAAGIDPHSPEGQRLLYAHMSPPGYLLNPSSSSGPQIGQVFNGYRFKGGNPNDRNSWEPAGGASPGSPTFP